MTRTILAVTSVLILALRSTMAQSPEIAAYSANRHITWTNGMNTSGVYRVEWTSSLTSTWRRTLQNVASVDALTNTVWTEPVPMFYRVIMATSPTPEGMVWIDPGSCQMGNCKDPVEGYGDELPVHEVFLSGLYVDEHEVCKSLWVEVHDWAVTNGYTFLSPADGELPDHPVSVTWYDAVKWCNARSEKEGLGWCYYMESDQLNVYRTGMVDVATQWVDWTSGGYRLPTEAEWERAARGGRRGLRFPWGDTISHRQANYDSTTNQSYDVSATRGSHPSYTNEPWTSPVGVFAANGYGLNDVIGNVSEWCWDWYDGSYYSVSPTSDPMGPDTSSPAWLRCHRGNARGYDASEDRVSSRGALDVRNLLGGVTGFRCVRSQAD